MEVEIGRDRGPPGAAVTIRLRSELERQYASGRRQRVQWSRTDRLPAPEQLGGPQLSGRRHRRRAGDNRGQQGEPEQWKAAWHAQSLDGRGGDRYPRDESTEMTESACP